MHDLMKKTMRFNKNGYIILYYPKYKNGKGKQVFLHRLVMENKIGRYLKNSEHVHHIDGNKLNNSPENLQILTLSEHTVLHAKQKGFKIHKKQQISCERCDKVFTQKKEGQKYCSIKCHAVTRRKVIRPSKEELKKIIWELSTVKIAQKYGVSDKSIEKWCKYYEIKKPPRGYWAKQYAKSNK